MEHFPIYVVGNRAFIDAMRRALLLDTVDRVDGLIGVGETPALAFHHLVAVAEEARVATIMEQHVQAFIAKDFFTENPLLRRARRI